jgi:4-hydroxyphenylacetate 3-monooxygenase
VTLLFTVAGTGETIALTPERLVIAGYTARDQAAVRAHIDELAHIGVAPPPRVPMYYDVPVDLATGAAVVEVAGTETSGEVEPVVVCTGGRWYLGVGSDHTDREVETRDIRESKASAPKPVGDHVVPLERAIAVWDGIELVSTVDGVEYQRGKLAAMLPPATLLDGVPGSLGTDALMFCGTLPLLTGAFVYGTHWTLELRLPGGTSLTHTYDVKRRSS